MTPLMAKLAPVRHLNATGVQPGNKRRQEEPHQPGRIPGAIHPILVSDSQNMEKE